MLFLKQQAKQSRIDQQGVPAAAAPAYDQYAGYTQQAAGYTPQQSYPHYGQQQGAQQAAAYQQYAAAYPQYNAVANGTVPQ
jgi:hypothetical protein